MHGQLTKRVPTYGDTGITKHTPKFAVGCLLLMTLVALLTGCGGATVAKQTKASQATTTGSPNAKLFFGPGASLARPDLFADVSFSGLTLSHAASIASVTDLGYNCTPHAQRLVLLGSLPR